ncbi:MAG: DUF4912 domain-containing protein [Vulcanococcus sp.]
MTQSNQPLGWLKKLVPTTLRDSVRSAISGGESAPAVAPSPATETASTYVVFLPRDPQWAYCFWSISSADQQRARKAGATSLCLRVADVTGLGFEQSHPHALQELVVDGAATEWFLPMPVDGRDYRVELGYRLRNGGWLSLAFSSVAHVPALDPSQRVADAFVPFSLDGPMGPASEPIGGGGGVQHEQLYQIATARPARSRRVGSELLHEYDAESGAGLFGDSGVGVWASGRSESGSGIVRPRSFWLVADAELIVYGATEPTASLFIGEEQIPLDADGTFRVHVPFRDGQQLYPIRAVAADGEQERSIRMEFERSTPQARVNTREQAELEWF